MRIRYCSIIAFTITAVGASAQSPQTAVDISISSAAVANGGVQAQITRKDPTYYQAYEGISSG